MYRKSTETSAYYYFLCKSLWVMKKKEKEGRGFGNLPSFYLSSFLLVSHNPLFLKILLVKIWSLFCILSVRTVSNSWYFEKAIVLLQNQLFFNYLPSCPSIDRSKSDYPFRHPALCQFIFNIKLTVTDFNFEPQINLPFHPIRISHEFRHQTFNKQFD